MVDLIFFSFFFHQYHGNINILLFNNVKYGFAIMSKVITLTVQGNCIKFTRVV